MSKEGDRPAGCNARDGPTLAGNRPNLGPGSRPRSILRLNLSAGCVFITLEKKTRRGNPASRVEKSRALEFEAPECERCGQECERGGEVEQSLTTLRLLATDLIALE